MTIYHSSATCEACLRERRAIAGIMEHGDREIARVTEVMRRGLIESMRARMIEVQRHLHDEEGSARVIDLACAFLVTFVVLACMALGHHVEPTVNVHYSTAPTATTTVAPQAPPETATGGLIPPAAVTAAPRAPRPAEVAGGVSGAPQGEILPSTWTMLTCDVLADGVDTTIGDGVPGWYRVGIGSDVADANPDHVRNCTPAEGQ